MKAFKALQYLGISKLWYFSLYQIGLRTGHYRRVTPSRRVDFTGKPGIKPFHRFPQISEAQTDLLLSEANAVRRGEFRLFGGDFVPLDLETGSSSKHWSALERIPSDQDPKFIWEPGRFGWAVTLARAYAFSGDPFYAQDFWEKSLCFMDAHLPNLGRQWQSAQEVAIRLMVLVFCDRVFAYAPSSTDGNRQRLWQAIAEHVQRIPPTLVYARAQNNNHLLSEAAGLYTAGLYLPDHPQAAQWRQIGWRWLNFCFQSQIDEFGTYIQHSTNYHRLMLQLALYVDDVRREAGDPDWPTATKTRLESATRWLWGCTDPQTGRVPNLGANDSAYIFQLSSQAFEDYRPVVDAAAKAFLNHDIYEQPDLAEFAKWFNLSAPHQPDQKQPQVLDMLRVESANGRAFIHTANFIDRPSHSDQLHVDIWWRGVNVAMDPGSYRYTAPEPWDNSLVKVQVHNTLTLDGRDQMLLVGRFLWLDWAQSQIIAHEMGEDGKILRVTAEHDGYRNMGAVHQRTLERAPNGWVVSDAMVPYSKARKIHQEVQITWLLPDWAWEVTGPNTLRLSSLGFSVELKMEGIDAFSLFRSGKCLYGTMDVEPTWGWTAPQYGTKGPALMVKGTVTTWLPIHIRSIWQFNG